MRRFLLLTFGLAACPGDAADADQADTGVVTDTIVDSATNTSPDAATDTHVDSVPDVGPLHALPFETTGTARFRASAGTWAELAAAPGANVELALEGGAFLRVATGTRRWLLPADGIYVVASSSGTLAVSAAAGPDPGAKVEVVAATGPTRVEVIAAAPIGYAFLDPAGVVLGFGIGAYGAVTTSTAVTVVVEPLDARVAVAAEVVAHALALADGGELAVAPGAALAVEGEVLAGGSDELVIRVRAGLEVRFVANAGFRVTPLDADGGAWPLAATGAARVPPTAAEPGAFRVIVAPTGAGGGYRVVASATACASGGGVLRVTEVLPAQAAAPLPVGEARGECGDADRDGALGAGDAFVEIVNDGPGVAALAGVALAVGGTTRYVFPCGAMLWPGQAAVVGERDAPRGLGLEPSGIAGRKVSLLAGAAVLDTVDLIAPPVGVGLVRSGAVMVIAPTRGTCGDADVETPWGYTPGRAGDGSPLAALPTGAGCATAPVVAAGGTARGVLDPGTAPCDGPAWAIELAAGERLRARVRASGWNARLATASDCAAPCAVVGAELDHVAIAAERVVLRVGGASPDDGGAFELDIAIER